MLAAGKGQGQIWLDGHLLCDVEYDISPPIHRDDQHQVQRIVLNVPDEHCAMLLDAYNLVLVLADGQRHHIPRPIQHQGMSSIECYIETLP